MECSSGRRAIVVSLVAVALSGGGCSLMSGAAGGSVGALVGLAANAVGTGTEVFALGKLDSFEFATLEQADAAVGLARHDLRLRIRSSMREKLHERYDLIDDTNAVTTIDLNRRTVAVCQFRVNVGIFGSEAMARLVLKSIRSHLPVASTQPTTEP